MSEFNVELNGSVDESQSEKADEFFCSQHKPSNSTSTAVPLLDTMYWYRTQYVKEEMNEFFKSNVNEIKLTIAADEVINSQHYEGHRAVQIALNEILPAKYILDAGCGFGAPARFIASATSEDTKVVGIEILEEFVSTATEITQAMSMCSKVSIVKWDLTQLQSLPSSIINVKEGLLFDGMVSFLCFLHVADKNALFKSISSCMKVGSKIYIEDFFSPLTEPVTPPESVNDDVRNADAAKIEQLLRVVVSCALPLPTQQQYTDILLTHGFVVDKFVDVTETWTEFTIARAAAYRAARSALLEIHDERAVDEYKLFYDTMAYLFGTGVAMKGTRITATKVL